MRRKSNFILCFIFGTSLILASCSPTQRLSTLKPAPVKTQPVVEEELISTTPDLEKINESKAKEGITYKPLQKTIKNKQTEIFLDRTKLDQTKITYDPNSRELHVSGLARVFDENKKEIDSSEFSITGQHAADDQIFYLKAENTKANSSQKPVVRAKVTCLNLDENEHYDCSRSVIDFFIAYKKQFFSEQMELQQKKSSTPNKLPAPEPQKPPSTPTAQPPAVTAASNDSTTAVAAPDHDELQAEGQEESLDGRYQGHIETVDLATVFDGDEEASPAPAAPVVTTPAPATTPNPTPTAPAPVTPPASTAVAPKDKVLTKDLTQTQGGDIRQVNQSIGFPDQGRLRNPTDVFLKQQSLNEKAFFEVAHTERHRYFATFEMAEMIARLGQNLNQNYNKKLFVSNLSQKSGGLLPPHKSHQIGLDADLGYPATQDKVQFPVVVEMKTRQFNPSSFSVEKSYALLKFAFKQNDIKVDRIFADRTIKKSLCDYAKKQGEFQGPDQALVQSLFESIDHVDGHGDHFHLRLKCSSYDPGCRQKIYPVNKGCD